MKNLAKVFAIAFCVFFAAECAISRRLTKKTGQKAKKKASGNKVMSSTSNGKLNEPCDLSIHIYPLVLFFVQVNIEFRVIFASTCLDGQPFMQYFTLKWDHNEVLTPSDHPSFVYLDIFGRVFNFKFMDGYERGQFPDLNVAYKFVRVHPANINYNVNTFEENNISLTPSDKTAQFTMADITKLRKIQNPFFCSVIEKGTIMQCILK